MSIPLAMSPVGYDTWVTELKRALITYLGTFQLVVDYLPDEKKLIVHTDRVSDEEYAEVAEIVSEYIPSGVTLVQWNHHIEVSWRNINKYANCTTVEQMYAVDPEKFELGNVYGVTLYFVKDLTSDGDFVYPLPKLKEATARHIARGGLFKYVRVKKFKILLPSATSLYGFINANHYIEELEFSCADSASFYQSQYNCSKLRKVSFTGAPTDIRCAWEWNGKMEEIYGDFSRVSNGEVAFRGCILNAESAIRVLTGLPTFTSGSHPITMGIHIDHKYNPEVNTALKRTGGAPGTSKEYFPPDGVVIDPIADDEYKGWTLTVEWNGTPTANAYPAPTT